MEISLAKAEVLWVAKPSENLSRAPENTSLIVIVPRADEQNQGALLPCNISIAAEELVTKSKTSLLDEHVTFKLLDDKKVAGIHAIKLRDCIPLLTEGFINWTQPVLHKGVSWDVKICISVSTDRRPRALIANAVAFRNRASSVARQLLLHKNEAVIGLLPIVAGCLVGVVGTSPVWLPLTLLIVVMGFPVWIAVGVGTVIATAFSALSAIVTVKLARSERVKGACQQFFTSQQGQLLLFEGMPCEEVLSPSALLARARTFVLETPSRKLVASLAIDMVGNATFVVPVLGELADVFWAPVSSRMVDALYKDSSPRFKYVAYLEELLPFTDIIPTATLAWIKENMNLPQLKKSLS